jgi:hypothetical protein
MNNIITKSNIKIAIMGGWAMLGFKRGVDSYVYSYSYPKINLSPDSIPLYSYGIFWGIRGIVTYVCPPLIFFSMHRELYRLEVNIRGLEYEKNTKYYNNAFDFL